MIRVLDVVGRQAWLDRFGDLLQQLINAGFGVFGEDTQGLRNLLHGTWLGHPLHPVFTDVALGGFTAAVTLDLVDQVTGDERLETGADAALGLGLAGAIGAAVTGLNDWQHTGGQSRRLGVMHALLNGTSTVLFTASLFARLLGNRGAGRSLASLGLGTSLAAAYIGGDLVYGKQIGVDHAALVAGPDEFTPALPDADLPEGQPRLAEVNGERFVLIRHGGAIHALAETCSHQGGPLSEGTMKDGGIVCPWHSSRFNVEDGGVLDGPATFPQPCFATRVRDGQIEIGPPQR